jgi:hypothetical protein
VSKGEDESLWGYKAQDHRSIMSRKIFPEFNAPAKAQDMDARKKDVIPDKEAIEGSIMSDNNMVLLLLHSHAVIVKQGFV